MTFLTSQAVANYTANLQQRQTRDLLIRKQRYEQGWEKAKGELVAPVFKNLASSSAIAF